MSAGSLKDLFVNYKSSATPTRLYKWDDSGLPEAIHYTTDKGRHIIVGFKIKEVPEFNEYSSSNAEDAYFKCLLRQKTFIDTVDGIFLSSKENFNSTVEIRIQNNPDNKIIECYLLLRFVTQFSHIDHTQLTAEFKRIVPDDYTFSSLNKEELESLLHLGSKHLLEITKADNLLPVGGIYQPGQISLPPMNYSGDISKARFYVPCGQYIDFNPYNWVDFYKIMQGLKEQVQVRISLSAVKLFEFEKNLALQYHNMVQATYANAMNADTSSYLLSFNKYLTSKRLFSIKIQMAGINDVSTKSVANAFCTQLSHGKLKTQLVTDDLGELDGEIKRSDWTECNHYYRPFELPYKNVENMHELVKAFMRRFKFLYDEVEATTLFRLPVAKTGGLPGMITRPVLPFYQPNPRAKKSAEIYLGQIIASNPWEEDEVVNSTLQYSFPVEDLTKHGLIVGSTGSGKTNTTLNFVKQLIDRNIPFLLIEPVKSEYYDELKGHLGGKLNRFNFKRPFLEDGTCNPEYLRFNPLIPMKGISIIQHISYIKGCLMAAFPMFGIMPLVLEECLYLYYSKELELREWRLFDPAISPEYPYHKEAAERTEEEQFFAEKLNVEVLQKIVDEYLDNKELFTEEDKTNFAAVLKRRIGKLTKGVLGNCFCPSYWMNFDEQAVIPDNLMKMFTEPTIIELEDLADNDEKALIMAFIMSYLFEYRQTFPSLNAVKKEQGEEFDIGEHIHITIIEEAHRLLSSGNSGGATGGEDGPMTQDSKAKAISLFIDMLAEIRAKGEGIFIVEQIPTKLVADVIKNTNLKIMHRITSKDDRKYLGDAMQMTELQQNYVTTLKTGHAIIFEEQLSNPVFVKLNYFE